MIKVITAAVCLFWGNLSWAQKTPEPVNKGVAWLSPQQAQANWQNEKKPFIIDVYTDWCHYCKIMEKSTWSNAQLGEYVAKYFYPIKFNAESKEPVSWMGIDYEYKTSYKVHMLAAEWCGGNMVYPSTIFWIPGEEPVIIPGVLTVKEIEPMLKYFGEGHYLKTEWTVFKTEYKSSWN
jgi:thioredoxin-related protein